VNAITYNDNVGFIRNPVRDNSSNVLVVELFSDSDSEFDSDVQFDRIM